MADSPRAGIPLPLWGGVAKPFRVGAASRQLSGSGHCPPQQNLLAIVRATGDSALRLAVVDFDSVDMDVEGLLLGSGLPCVASSARAAAFVQAAFVQAAFVQAALAGLS